MSNNRKWVTVGTIRKQTVTNHNGEESTKTTLVFDRSVRLQVGRFNADEGKVMDFQDVDLGRYRNARLVPADVSIDSLLEKGHIDEEEANRRRAFNAEKGVVYNVAVPPVEND